MRLCLVMADQHDRGWHLHSRAGADGAPTRTMSALTAKAPHAHETLIYRGGREHVPSIQSE
jgi:hypothetical protein